MHELESIFWPRCRGAKKSPLNPLRYIRMGIAGRIDFKASILDHQHFFLGKAGHAGILFLILSLPTGEKHTPYYDGEERERERG